MKRIFGRKGLATPRTGRRARDVRSIWVLGGLVVAARGCVGITDNRPVPRWGVEYAVLLRQMTYPS